MAKIIGHGAPTVNTPASLGQEYFDADAKITYTCTNVAYKSGDVTGEHQCTYEWATNGGNGTDVSDVERLIKQTILGGAW